MEEAAKGALRRPDRAHGTAGKSGRKSARPGSACLHCLSLHGSVAPTYSGVLPTRAAVQCRRSSSAPPPAPPAPSCPLPPAAAPPSPPRPLIPPGLPPPSVCGGEGGALTGGALWVPCSWAGGGALPSLALWARPRAPYLGASPGLAIQAVRDAIAPLPTQRGKTRPARTSGTECHPALCAPNYLFGRSPRTANNTAGRPATASRLVRPPRASGRVRRGRLTRSPLFRSASPCRSCCIVLWSLLGFAAVRVCALGARRKRRSWSSPEKTPFTQAITTEIEHKSVAKSEKPTERRKNAPSNSRKAVLQRRKARNTRESHLHPRGNPRKVRYRHRGHPGNRAQPLPRLRPGRAVSALRGHRRRKRRNPPHDAAG